MSLKFNHPSLIGYNVVGTQTLGFWDGIDSIKENPCPLKGELDTYSFPWTTVQKKILPKDFEFQLVISSPSSPLKNWNKKKNSYPVHFRHAF